MEIKIDAPTMETLGKMKWEAQERLAKTIEDLRLILAKDVTEDGPAKMLNKGSTLQELIDAGILTVRAINSIRELARYHGLPLDTYNIGGLEAFSNELKKTPNCGSVTVEEIAGVLLKFGVDMRTKTVEFKISPSEERYLRDVLAKRRYGTLQSGENSVMIINKTE